MSGWDGDRSEAPDHGDRGSPPERSLFVSVVLGLCALLFVVLGVSASGALFVGVGLSATGVGAGAGPLLVCAPMPAILGLVIAAYVWRRG